MPTPLYISAAHKSSGKTTITIGLLSALYSENYLVQPFKKGPDYIDPIWHSRAAQSPCYSLDFNTMSENEITDFYYQRSLQAQISIIEGNKGLYDGIDLEGSNSNAALAKLLNAKVILVLDCNGMTRGVAPLILGYQDFDHDINIGGVILNQVGGARHEQKLIQMIEHYTDVPVLGAVHKNKELAITERHLGLVPSNEGTDSDNKIHQITQLIKQQVNLEEIANQALKDDSVQTDNIKSTPSITPTYAASKAKINIAIIKDQSFGFYYPADLEALEIAGANLIEVNSLVDTKLPQNIQGLFIGGGFPEIHMYALSKNDSLKQHIYQHIQDGLPTYAECGGLMYLCRSLQWDGVNNNSPVNMVGIIPADVVMSKKPQGRGLIQYTETSNMLWPDSSELNIKPTQSTIQPERHADNLNKIFNAHEFHYSRLENLDPNTTFAYTIKRGYGINGEHDGIVIKNLLASYAHLQDTKQNHWAQRFVNFINTTLNRTLN